MRTITMLAASPPPSLRLRSAVCVRSRPLRGVATYTSDRAPASLYHVLGVSTSATCHEIKAAYRRLARVWHPDVVATDRKEASADEFMKVHAAYSTLSDLEKREDYDRKLLERPFPAASSRHFRRAASFGGGGRRTWETDQCW